MEKLNNKMKQQNAEADNDEWAVYYALMMQRNCEREIKEAIEKVKRGVVSNNCQKRRKRGYWTPTGFAWFKRKRRWRNYKGHALGLRGNQKIRQ